MTQERELVTQGPGGATWFIIGIGGTGCNIVDAFFRALDRKAIRIEPLGLASVRDNGNPKYLTEAILKYGVAGKHGWWLYSTSTRDLESARPIIWKKFRTLYPNIEAKRTGKTDSDNQDKRVEKKKKIAADELAFRDRMTEHFTSGLATAEGAGKWWIGGDESTRKIRDPGYWEETSGKKDEPKIKHILDNLEKMTWRNSNGMLVVHGLGRGTGSGATYRIVRILRQIREPLYVATLTVLPPIEEAVESRYESAILQTSFGLLSLLQDENDRKLAGVIMLAHDSTLHELCLRKRSPFLHADLQFTVFGHRLFSRLSTRHVRRDNYDGLLVDLMGLLSSTHVIGREEEAFDLSNLVKAVDYPTSDPEMPGIAVPCFYVSPNRKATVKELMTGAIQEGRLAGCDPLTSRAIYVILYLDTKVVGNSQRDIYETTNRTTCELFHQQRMPTLSTPDYIDTGGSFAASVVLLINPRIPILEDYFSRTSQYFADFAPARARARESEAVQMYEAWEKRYKQRAKKLLAMLGRKD